MTLLPHMLFLVSAIAFFFLITGLIIIHELGHFFAARKAGVVVEEFGFGLPPLAKILFKWQGTKFTLNWIPFGGFVRLRGESGEEGQPKKGNFTYASIPVRCGILVAGVGMNLLLAILIFIFGFSYGRWIPTYLSLNDMKHAAARGDIHLKLGVLIDDVLVGGTAAESKIPKGDLLLAVNGTPVTDPVDVVLMQAGKQSVTYTYSANMPNAQAHTQTVAVQGGKTGVLLESTTLELSGPQRNIVAATGLALRETWVVTQQTIIGIAKLFSSLAEHAQVPAGVTGIVGIAQLTYASVQKGFMVYLRLVALLSLSLAVLNIIPFPALDGGRVLFVLSELFVRPKTRSFETITNTVGFGILLLVIAIVTLYDIVRLFS